MLCCVFLLLFFCRGSVEFLTKPGRRFSYNPTSYELSTFPLTTEERLSSLQVVASPDYPVSTGQTVHLHCRAFSAPKSVTWSWQHLVNQTWREVGSEKDLTLSKPEQSGLYYCRARGSFSKWKVSSNHSVFIISRSQTVGENLGIAAFALVLLVLIINLAALSWVSWKNYGDRLNTSITTAKGFPPPEKTPKGGLQQTATDGDVYMNYTNTNQAYSDLDPASMNDDNVYSSLS